MIKFVSDKEFISYNDVLLVPQQSNLDSRYDKEISLSVEIAHGFNLDLPVISANMDTVTEKDMAFVMQKYGGLGIFHRYYSTLEKMQNDFCSMEYCKRIGFSVGCDTTIECIKKSIDIIRETYLNPDIYICLDVANGHLQKVVDKMKELNDNIKYYYSRLCFIAGNVVSGEAAYKLAIAGANVIKVGIGPGSVCTTRIVTGHGFPQLSAIDMVRITLDAAEFPHVGIIADGGIKSSGDIVKALAAGANAVMIGNLFAGTDEAPGDIINHNQKIYRGQSSRSFMDDISKFGRASEGETITVPYKGSMVNVLKEIEGGIRSGLTYSGARNIYELQEKAKFVKITPNGYIEGTPHGKN